MRGLSMSLNKNVKQHSDLMALMPIAAERLSAILH